MNKGVQTLSEREKETLRLLLAGHDAKSIARDLGLSVHTVNERLRDARRKLDVTSSREAARILGDVEKSDPNCLVYKEFAVAAHVMGVSKRHQPDRRRGVGHPLAWLGGGMLIMSLIIAAAVLSSAFVGSSISEPDSVVSASASNPASTKSAREWVALLDGQRWDESWHGAAAIFQSRVSAPQWASTIRSVRQPLGIVSSRTLQNATKTNVLPGAPAGEYEVLQFQTKFAQKNGAVETIIMAREGSKWKVAGYFIR